MKNEIYGEITLGVKMPVSANNERLAMLEANYHASDLTIDEVRVILINRKTGRIHNVQVHNWYIEWERFFGEDE